MRKLNKIPSIMQVFIPVLTPLPRYQSADGFTLDVDEALKTPLGEPIQLGYSDTVIEKAVPKHTISFNPLDPDMRSNALLMRAHVNNSFVDSTIYSDKLELAQKSNNMISALERNVKSTNFNIETE